jgi:aspartyl-tRNA(Asn)/glutamyl-tRNA(Gln) amidotransferase subunit A
MALWEKGAADAAAEMRDGTLSVVDYVEACLSRIAATEADVQAWEYVDEDGARREAKRLDSLPLAERTGRLFGVPIGVKDVIDVQGQPTRAAFEPYHDAIAAEDSGAVAQLRAEQAVLVGKTVTAQFAWSQDTPKTRNPWSLRHTPGASSSGSAAAVGARQVPVTIGTQTTSSLLRPAAYCGAVAVKASYGVVSCRGVVPTAWSSDHPGVMACNVRDAGLVMDVLAQHDPGDPHSVLHQPSGLREASAEAGSPPRLAVLMDLVDRATPEVRAAFDETRSTLAAAGAQVEEIRLPFEFDLVLAMHWIIHNSDAAAIHFEGFARNPDAYLPTVRTNIEVSQLVPAPMLVHARRWRRKLEGAVASVFAGYDALLAPTSSDMPPLRDNDARQNRMGDPSFQILANAFGLPATSVPSGVSAEGLPYAVQVIGPAFADARVLGAAAWCESSLGQLTYPSLD